MCDARCKHGVNPDYCSFCKPVALPPKKDHVKFVDYDRCANWCDAETLEYLRRNAVIRAQVPDHAADVFEREMDAFEVEFTYGRYVSFSKVKDREEKRWYSAKVIFPHNDDLTFEKNLKIVDVKSSDKKEINSIAFVGFLLANGFCFGHQKKSLDRA